MDYVLLPRFFQARGHCLLFVLALSNVEFFLFFFLFFLDQLHDAAAAGDLAAIERILDVESTGTALVDPLKHDGTTPLIAAGSTLAQQNVASAWGAPLPPND